MSTAYAFVRGAAYYATLDATRNGAFVPPPAAIFANVSFDIGFVKLIQRSYF